MAVSMDVGQHAQHDVSQICFVRPLLAGWTRRAGLEETIDLHKLQHPWQRERLFVTYRMFKSQPTKPPLLLTRTTRQ